MVKKLRIKEEIVQEILTRCQHQWIQRLRNEMMIQFWDGKKSCNLSFIKKQIFKFFPSGKNPWCVNLTVLSEELKLFKKSWYAKSVINETVISEDSLYMYWLYKKNFQIPSVGKGGKGRRLFVNFPDYFQKCLILVTFFRK